MRDTLKQRLFDLGYGTGSKTPSEAITYIEELELELYEMNELYGSVKDGLEEKLATAMEALREITGRHIPDCPASFGGDELEWAVRQHTALRATARTTLTELEGK